MQPGGVPGPASDVHDFLAAIQKLTKEDIEKNLVFKERTVGPDKKSMATLKLGKDGDKDLKLRFLGDLTEKMLKADDAAALMHAQMQSGNVIFQRTIKEGNEKKIEAFTSKAHQGASLVRKSGEVISIAADEATDETIKTLAAAFANTFHLDTSQTSKKAAPAQEKAATPTETKQQAKEKIVAQPPQTKAAQEPEKPPTKSQSQEEAAAKKQPLGEEDRAVHKQEQEKDKRAQEKQAIAERKETAKKEIGTEETAKETKKEEEKVE